MILVIGGSASGKSEYAERLVLKLPGPHVYLATMAADDAESRERVSKHREARKHSDFRTVERAAGLEGADIREGDIVLLECLSNLAANEMFPADGPVRSPEETEERLVREVLSLKERAGELVIVGNRLTGGGTDYEGLTDAWLRAFSAAQNRIAAEADEVWRVTGGIPERLK